MTRLATIYSQLIYLSSVTVINAKCGHITSTSEHNNTIITGNKINTVTYYRQKAE